ncbi:hypothetical protein DSECCO2_462190 [anaerobic digester metagenome]
MGNINHRAAFSRVLLRSEKVIRCLGLPESVHNATVKRVGMVTPVMVERVPEASAHMLPSGLIKCVQAGVGVWRVRIMLRLGQHG